MVNFFPVSHCFLIFARAYRQATYLSQARELCPRLLLLFSDQRLVN
jgi:hypothetical protein